MKRQDTCIGSLLLLNKCSTYNGLKQHTFEIPFCKEVLKSRYHSSCIPARGSAENLCPCFLPASGGRPHSSLMVPMSSISVPFTSPSLTSFSCLSPKTDTHILEHLVCDEVSLQSSVARAAFHRKRGINTLLYEKK